LGCDAGAADISVFALSTFARDPVGVSNGDVNVGNARNELPRWSVPSVAEITFRFR
jgi:hypothetical protein